MTTTSYPPTSASDNALDPHIRDRIERDGFAVERDGEFFVLSNYEERVLFRFTFKDLLYFYLGDEQISSGLTLPLADAPEQISSGLTSPPVDRVEAAVRGEIDQAAWDACRKKNDAERVSLVKCMKSWTSPKKRQLPPVRRPKRVPRPRKRRSPW